MPDQQEADRNQNPVPEGPPSSCIRIVNAPPAEVRHLTRLRPPCLTAFLVQRFPNKHTQQLVEFIRSSKRGICRESGGLKAAPEEGAAADL